jgi:hypothetical protein
MLTFSVAMPFGTQFEIERAQPRGRSISRRDAQYTKFKRGKSKSKGGSKGYAYPEHYQDYDKAMGSHNNDYQADSGKYAKSKSKSGSKGYGYVDQSNNGHGDSYGNVEKGGYRNASKSGSRGGSKGKSKSGSRGHGYSDPGPGKDDTYHDNHDDGYGDQGGSDSENKGYEHGGKDNKEGSNSGSKSQKSLMVSFTGLAISMTLLWF